MYVCTSQAQGYINDVRDLGGQVGTVVPSINKVVSFVHALFLKVVLFPKFPADFDVSFISKLECKYMHRGDNFICVAFYWS